LEVSQSRPQPDSSQPGTTGPGTTGPGTTGPGTTQPRRWGRLLVWGILGVALLWPIARRLYRQLTPIDAGSIYQTGLRELAAGELGKTQLAIERLAALGNRATADSIPPYQQVLEAAIDLRFGRGQQAATRLIPALEDPATSAIAYTMTGEAFYKNRQFGDAIDMLSRAVELDDSLVTAHQLLAAAYYDIGATGPTIDQLKLVSSMAPEDPRPHRLMGLIYKDMEAFDDAIPQYQEALRRSADFADRPAVLLELAACLLGTGRYNELEQILVQCPATATVQYYAAEVLAARSQSQPALEKLELALSMEPENLPALLMQAKLLTEQSKMEEALAVLQHAVDAHPYDAGVHYQLSQLYARQGDKELAAKHAAESGRLRQLRIHFAELHAAASVNSSDAEVRYQLGMAAQELGLTEMAASWLGAALSLQPQHAAASAALQALQQPPLPENAQPDSPQSDAPPPAEIPQTPPGPSSEIPVEPSAD